MQMQREHKQERRNSNLKITEVGVSQGGGGHNMFQAKPNPNL
jgi:hypothetical protein